MGNSGPGSIWHLAAAAIETKTNVKFNHVGFGGAAPAVLSLLGGHIDAVAVSPGEVATHVQGGKLRTLAVASDKRVKGFESVPTFKERNLDISLGTWRGLAAPKGTPPEILSKINAALKLALKDADFVRKQDGLGATVVSENSVEPAEHKRYVLAEIAKWSPVIKAAGVYAD